MGLNIYILTYKQKEKYSGMEWLKGKLVFLYIGFKQWECQGLVLIHMGRAETWVSLWVFVGLAMGIGSSVLIKQGSTIGWDQDKDFSFL